MDHTTTAIAADIHVWREIHRNAQAVLDPQVGYGAGDHEAITKRAIYVMQEAAERIIKTIPEAVYREIERVDALKPVA